MARTGRDLHKTFANLLKNHVCFNVLLDDEKTWLCPYCGAPAVADRGSPDFEELAFKHVIEQCPKAGGLVAPPLSKGQLQEQVIHARFKAQYLSEPAWRIRVSGGVWLCPFCVQATNIKMVAPAGAQRTVDGIVRDIHAHFGRCYDYARSPGKWHTIEEIKAKLNEAKLQEQLVKGIAAQMGSDPVFQFSDKTGNWICPFCETPIGNVDFSTPLARTHSAPRQALVHFQSRECRYQGGELISDKTVEQMQEIVRRLSGETAEAEPAAETPEAEPSYLESLRSELGELRSQLGQDKKLQQDLERARKAQRRMLPSEPPAIPGYDFDVYFQACEQVSGDFFDFILLKDGRIGIVMGDISGHGIDAGIVMGMTKKAFALRAQSGDDPTTVVSHVNGDILPELEKATFVTAIYGILDPGGHTFQFVRCGHTFPAHYKAAAGEVEDVTSKGLVMGSLKGPLFEKKLELKEVTLGPGDSLTLYTDGIMEAMTEEEEEFGLERAGETIRRHGPAGSAQAMIEGVIGAVHIFTRGHPQADDETLIVIQRLPGPESAPIAVLEDAG